ncbi:MAG: FAD-dependent oxidoreductase [Nitrobacter sp.]
MTQKHLTEQYCDLTRIVVVGGGVAGVEIATELGRRRNRRGNRYAVTLLDADSAHIWKPMLHMIAAGTRDVYQQQIAYAAQARSAGFNYQPGAMCGLDRARKEIEVASLTHPDGRVLLGARRLSYDVLILAVGSRANDFSTPGVKERCFTIDSRIEADHFNREMRIRILQSAADKTDLSVAIVGGGATGVELAAELVQLAEAADSYGAVGTSSRIKLSLLEAGERLLAAFPEDISGAVCRRLEQLGVDVRLGAQVSVAEDGGFRLKDGKLVAAMLKVWAAGVKASDFLHELDGLETTRSNQLVVTPSLQTTRDPSIFAVGDCASLKLPGMERPLPPTAQLAHQQAKHLVDHLPDWLEGKPVPAFAYHDFGSLVSLAQYDGYASLGKFGLFRGGSIKGRLAQLSHALLYRGHQARIHGFWRGGLVWLVDRLNGRLRPSIRLD